MTRMIRRTTLFVVMWLLTAQASAQMLAGEQLVEALQGGGHVIVMRHASSPRALPDAGTANPDNPDGERQLDDAGAQQAVAFGEALQKLDIEISEVVSSPTYRALQTARLAGFQKIEERAELGNEGMRESSAQYSAWLLEQVADEPTNGNRLLITHGPNINAAFAAHAEGMDEGEALVFDPADSTPVARIKLSDWPML